jgi:hypothetical protein
MPTGPVPGPAQAGIEAGIPRFPEVQLHVRGLALTHHPEMTELKKERL